MNKIYFVYAPAGADAARYLYNEFFLELSPESAEKLFVIEEILYPIVIEEADSVIFDSRA